MPDVNVRTSLPVQTLTAIATGVSLGIAIALVQTSIDTGDRYSPNRMALAAGLMILASLAVVILSLSSPSRERPRAHGETCGKSAVMSLSERVLVCEAERGHAGTHRAGAVYFQTAEELSASPFTSST